MENKNIETALLGCAIVNLMAIYFVIKKKATYKTRVRKMWCRNWLRRREEGKGILSLLNCELKSEDASAYNNFLRLCEKQTEYLLTLINDDIKTQDTILRDAIPARDKSVAKLYFLLKLLDNL
ncbi:hypothetical protein PPYR_15387 [Photinus pyralis]|uniref:Uncharacterized protein n=1 Tax=Photinus pyralis TaxID=7054 RepID=A0A5N3ZYX9_PHOPY|nr:hypothetical protein PPYR_15387 [Photinus pyralis]